MSLKREQILKKRQLPRVRVDVPEWADEEGEEDSFIYVQSLTGKQRDAFERSVTSVKGSRVETNLENIRVKAAVVGCVDEEGNRIFTDADIPDLNEQSAMVLDRIFAEFMKLNGMSKEDVEDLAKNSDGDPIDSSPSG